MRQWRDVLGILKIQAGVLERDYLREWAKELKVSDLLDQALKESIYRSFFEPNDPSQPKKQGSRLNPAPGTAPTGWRPAGQPGGCAHPPRLPGRGR